MRLKSATSVDVKFHSAIRAVRSILQRPAETISYFSKTPIDAEMFLGFSALFCSRQEEENYLDWLPHLSSFRSLFILLAAQILLFFF